MVLTTGDSENPAATEEIAITYVKIDAARFHFASTGIHLLSPRGGEVWDAREDQLVRWEGIGPVDVLLSTSGKNKPADVLAVQELLNGIVIPASLIPRVSTEAASIQIRRQGFSRHGGSLTSGSSYVSPATFTILGPDIAYPFWNTTVESSGDVGRDVSMVLGADDRPMLLTRREVASAR